MNPPPEIALFLGRLHVLLLHVPIALIGLLAVLEWLSRLPRFRHANANAGIILALAAPAAIVTAGCGWLLSWSGGYDAKLLQWHKWTGIATASIAVMAALLYRLDLRKAYRLCVFSSVIVLIVASHFGGSLTHGSDYLVRYAPGPFRSWLRAPAASQNDRSASATVPASKEVFVTLVQPVFQQNCVACHGPEKTKGHLRLDSFDAILKGGENGPAIVPGKPLDSLLVKRVQLPASSDDHMPPEGKPQPSASDIALLQWWIGAGAPTNKTIAQLKPPPNIGRIIEARIGSASPALANKGTARPMAAHKIAPMASKIADELGIVIAPVSQNEPWLQCNASVAGTNFGDQQLSRLAPLRLNLRWLDLGGTAITDRALPEIARMANLTRLHLERTTVTDDALEELAPLDHLEYLNLYGTGVSDAGLQHLQALARLKKVYLWETKVSLEAATNFAQARIDSDQIARWQEQIEQLKAKILGAHFVIDVGLAAPRMSSTNSSGTNAPLATNSVAAASAVLNTQCPVSGKPVDSAKTLTYNGKLVAFCCDDCKAKFEQDPKPFVAKLAPNAGKEQASAQAGQ
jgi:YHS domain-containing protein/mono/diheme cytochrome c family protein